jgi:hypothetical protein
VAVIISETGLDMMQPRLLPMLILYDALITSLLYVTDIDEVNTFSLSGVRYLKEVMFYNRERKS